MSVPSDLQVILSAKDTDALREDLSKRPIMSQNELNHCLLAVIQEGSPDIIKILLERGAKLIGLSCAYAIDREDTEVLQLLVDYGWDIDSPQFDLPPVMSALSHQKTLRWLLEKGASPNTMSKRQRGSVLIPCTPLVAAADKADTTGLRLLLSYGAKLDPLALFHAIGVGRGHKHGVEAMDVLIAHGADVNKPVGKWGTPLHQAVAKNSMEKVKLLLKHGADPNIRETLGKMSSLEYAKQLGRMDLYEVLANVCIDGTT